MTSRQRGAGSAADAGASALRRRHLVERRQELDGDGDLRLAAAARRVASRRSRRRTCRTTRIPCRGGGEIGRAQVAQAEACGLEPEPAMNPILLKPNGNGTSQVVRERTRVEDAAGARATTRTSTSCGRTCSRAYDDLARRFDVVVIEGAGSVSELNLRAARSGQPRAGHARFGAPWLLVADIERGGVFASVLGTVALLTRRRARAVPRLRDQQVPRRPRRCSTTACGSSRSGPASPCLGVFPYARGHAPRRRRQPGAADRGRATPAPPGARHRDRPASRACRTPPTSGC